MMSLASWASDEELRELRNQLAQARGAGTIALGDTILCLHCRHAYTLRHFNRWVRPEPCSECGSTRFAYFDQTTRAFIAEWLTELLGAAGGVRLVTSLRMDAVDAGWPWEIVKYIADRLGFAAEQDRWRLPDDHPLRG